MNKLTFTVVLTNAELEEYFKGGLNIIIENNATDKNEIENNYMWYVGDGKPI